MADMIRLVKKDEKGIKQYTVEKVWSHNSNVCVVLMNHSSGCRCGYVGIPIKHHLFGKDYNQDCKYLQELREALTHETIGKRGIISVICWDGKGVSPEILFDVHGGLTYSGEAGEYPIEMKDVWWFGFDCAHSGDRHEIDQIFPESSREFYTNFSGDIVRSFDYCVSECESLSNQLEELK